MASACLGGSSMAMTCWQHRCAQARFQMPGPAPPWRAAADENSMYCRRTCAHVHVQTPVCTRLSAAGKPCMHTAIFPSNSQGARFGGRPPQGQGVLPLAWASDGMVTQVIGGNAYHPGNIGLPTQSRGTAFKRTFYTRAIYLPDVDSEITNARCAHHAAHAICGQGLCGRPSLQGAAALQTPAAWFCSMWP